MLHAQDRLAVEIFDAAGEIVRAGNPKPDANFPDRVFRCWLPCGFLPQHLTFRVHGQRLALALAFFGRERPLRGWKLTGSNARGQVILTGRGAGVTVYVPEPEPPEADLQLSLFGGRP